MGAIKRLQCVRTGILCVHVGRITPTPLYRACSLSMLNFCYQYELFVEPKALMAPKSCMPSTIHVIHVIRTIHTINTIHTLHTFIKLHCMLYCDHLNRSIFLPTGFYAMRLHPSNFCSAIISQTVCLSSCDLHKTSCQAITPHRCIVEGAASLLTLVIINDSCRTSG